MTYILKVSKYDQGVLFEDSVYGYLKPAFDELYKNVCREYEITHGIYKLHRAISSSQY